MKRRNLAAVAGRLWRQVSELVNRSASDVKKRVAKRLTILCHYIKAALYSILATLLRCVKIATKKFHV